MEITIKWNVDSKSDEEAKKKVEALLKNAHGTLLPQDLDAVCTVSYFYKLKVKIDRLKMDLQTRDEEIQDLKLENDRLMQQNKLMIDYIHALACIESKKSKFFAPCECSKCPYHDHNKEFGKGACQLESRELIEKEAANIIDKLEDL